MFITSQSEIISLMPTARWDRPEQLFGYLEEEERVALEPLLGTPLYEHLCREYERLTGIYVDITAVTMKPTRKAKAEPDQPYADVTELQDRISARKPYQEPCVPTVSETDDVPEDDMLTVRLLRICQQIEFYKMIAHKTGMLTVSFNEGGGMNRVSAEGYEPADAKEMEHVVKDAVMSAGRAVDSLLLFLEADAKGKRLFTELWQQADAFYLHKDLLFQTAKVLNEYLDIKGERLAYVQLVRDIRFCQNTYLKPRIGSKLLTAVIDFLNGKNGNGASQDSTSQLSTLNSQLTELASLLRTALAFYVESRRQTLGPKDEKLARRDSMNDAQQALAMACEYVEDNLDALGDAAVDTPIYNAVRAREEQAQRDREDAQAACERRRKEACQQSRKKLFTAFPATHPNTDTL